MPARSAVRFVGVLAALAWAAGVALASDTPQAADEPARRLPGVEPAAGESPAPEPFVGIPADRWGTAERPIPVPDRWRLIESLGVHERWYDPYHQNTLKGDRPIAPGWFVDLSLISDTVLEQRALLQSVIGSFSLMRGDTSFKPPDFELRVTPVLNVFASRLSGTDTTVHDVGLQEAFVTVHLRDVSMHYDFDALRVGIQPFNADFRGFLFQDQPVGLRVFGNRQNNRLQYNVAWFRRFHRDRTGTLNDVSQPLRDEDLFLFTLYRQDTPRDGFTSQLTAIWDRNRELQGEQTGFDVGFVGYNGDGHLGRVNLTAALYVAVGRTLSDSAVTDVRAWFVAFEPSVDLSYARLRGSLLWASGDRDPDDGRSEGFDAIAENPMFAGADTSYWIRQSPLLADLSGNEMRLTSRNGLLPALRATNSPAPAHFDNPGLGLIGGDADFELTPKVRLSLGARYLRFANTAVLEALVARPVAAEIGWDCDVALTWRPLLNQNLVLRLSAAALFPGGGFEDLYPAMRDERALTAVLFGVILAY